MLHCHSLAPNKLQQHKDDSFKGHISAYSERRTQILQRLKPHSSRGHSELQVKLYMWAGKDGAHDYFF